MAPEEAGKLIELEIILESKVHLIINYCDGYR